MTDAATESEPRLLTPRQLEVLELLAKGLTNKEIGGALGISAGTAKRHVGAIIEALDVTNRTEAATRLHELGLGSAGRETSEAFTVPGFGSRPAIAVLPFENLSPDPDQAFLADGVVEDLITRLAGWRWFPVIARNSTFVYKGRAVDVVEVSRALGARYVVEGSVRAAGSRIRITVQLIDGETGQHVWAKHFDRERAEVFDTEDEIVDSLVATLEPALLKLEGLRSLSRRPEQLDAWESIQRGFVHASENTWEGFEKAQPHFARAAEIDPRLATASQLDCYCEFQLLLLGRVPDPLASLARVDALARRTRSLDPSDPFSLLITGWSHLLRGDPASALAAYEQSLALGPSVAWAHAARGLALGALGRGEEAVASVSRALRLSPQDPQLHFFEATMGMCLLPLGRVDEASEHLRRALQEGPELPHANMLLAVCHVMRGELEEARARVARLQEIAPEYDPRPASQVFGPPGSAEAVAVLLEQAGWRAPTDR